MTSLRPCGKAAFLTSLALGILQTAPAAAGEWVRADMKDQVKGCKVTVYEEPHFHGARWTTTNGWAVIGWEFDNKISSIRVQSGIWQFFKDDHFQNQIETLFPGSYAALKPNSDNTASSFRCVRAT